MEYAITARKTNKPITKTHYYDYLDKLSDLGDIGNVNFEDHRGLHLHFLLKSKDKVPYAKFRPTKRGWNVKAIPIHDKRNWISYCRKDRFQGNNDLDDGFIMPTKSLFKT